MRQVPESAVKHSILILGDGRLARHLFAYLSAELVVSSTSPETSTHLHAAPSSTVSASLGSTSVLQWSRKREARGECESFARMVAKATHLIFAVSDRAIESLVAQAREQAKPDAIFVHCSGALQVEGAHCAHPLMTFSDRLYDHETYLEIPFIIDEDGPRLDQLVPGLWNPSLRLSRKNRPLYHALCAASGNLVSLLWKEAFARFEELGIPAEVLRPYLSQIAINSIADPVRAPTGALVRGDDETIRKHLEALDSTLLGEVYEVFARRMRADAENFERGSPKNR